MKRLVYVIFPLLIISMGACRKKGPDTGQLAAIAAKGYYDLLLDGKYREFVAGIYQAGKIPPNYHKQLLMNAQMFMEQQEEEHKGIVKVKILNAKADTAHHVADVFLYLIYGDHTKEQIVVPMVEVGNKWKMR